MTIDITASTVVITSAGERPAGEAAQAQTKTAEALWDEAFGSVA